MSTTDKIKHQMAIMNTLQFMTIQVQRLTAHADIVGDGEQILINDDLRILIDKYGLLAETVSNYLRAILETSEDIPAVVIYDADGNELDSMDKAV